jgi:hypothetical protein
LVAGVRIDDGVDLDDVIDITSMMVYQGRVPPPSKWVDKAVAEALAAALVAEVEGLF